MKKKISSLMLMVILALTSISTITAQANVDIKIGDYLQMGTYKGSPMLWRCVDIDENGPLMLSDTILCRKQFDNLVQHATVDRSGSAGRAGRKGSSSNYWGDSNIRCWLNSDASAGNVVYTCGNPPDYADEAGFLTNFSEDERKAMKTVTQKAILDGFEYTSSDTPDENYYSRGILDHCVSRVSVEKYDKFVNNYDTAYSEDTTDTVFLLDVKQLYQVYYNLGDYYILGKNNQYWLRTPWTDYDDSYAKRREYYGTGVLTMEVHDVMSAREAYEVYGIRPAFYLDIEKCSFSSGEGDKDAPFTDVKLQNNISNIASSPKTFLMITIILAAAVMAAALYVIVFKKMKR